MDFGGTFFYRELPAGVVRPGLVPGQGGLPATGGEVGRGRGPAATLVPSDLLSDSPGVTGRTAANVQGPVARPGS